MSRRYPIRARQESGEIRVKTPWEQYSLDSTKRIALMNGTSVVSYHTTMDAAWTAKLAADQDGKHRTIMINKDHADMPDSTRYALGEPQTLGAEWYDAASADVWWRRITT